MIYIDTNVFIYAIENHREYGKACKKILMDIQNNELKTSASVLVLIEIVNVLTRINKELKKLKQRQIDVKQNIEAILSLPIIWFDIEFLTIKRAAEYTYSLNTQDYFHIATMEINSIREIISADKELDKVEQIKRTNPLNY